jgi:hypothetical protein
MWSGLWSLVTPQMVGGVLFVGLLVVGRRVGLGRLLLRWRERA